MKKIIFTFLGYFLIISNIFAGAMEDSIIPTNNGENIVTTNSPEGKDFLFSIFEYIKDSIFGLLAFITISVFLFIGAKLIIARGNPEEFKKGLMQFIYAIVGLLFIALSWALVTLVSSLNF